MSFDPSLIFLSLFPSGIGLALFMYGKKQQRWPQLTAGLLLMVYPYFTATAVSLVVTGSVIGLALWGALRLDW
jgi:multisubunit Na+/H+ antiporter MnhC subunit